MPNLQQIKSLREKYSARNNVYLSDIRFLSENFNKSSYEIKSLFVNNNRNPNLLDYFESQQSADVVLLFIDITSFSTKCRTMTNYQLSNYLDIYYDRVISSIYFHGGEVEKIIGDGIICLFGQPFLSDSKRDLFKKADACAKDIIIDLKGSDMEVKIAMHDGTVMYYKNKTENYPEYTMIGKPLTELFRLESVSENNSVNFYHISDYNSMDISNEGVYKYSHNNTHSYWKKSGLIPANLKGVDWSFIKQFTCTYKT
ncbi:adenylate/guanylate cyclase domain-containing protein [Elizabethkingia anophelis]|uniref:Adenylate cyclase n=1 Tax=Elizabethkingia anophelis TaxID=1117645 RepID=A0A455ZEI7_9FLAO|nr:MULTISPECIES: adenylate/guanylate cyclase domain-containing protein [Elizabethkingia]KUF46135.1 hypothetical protein AS358_10445 [Elizabethkingia anophelis]MCT3644210.1 adenylate/guanylate cyclase domain-containing protein [Elizabethkingia anophelis]MCT3650531.1 adenylate/guanylate cyclase domain-containing protein [Elizabethkingia anophelis]MCT3656435.1 adenylate/guanylate cyclase domain-containing protein [Elizabethkingia anophelis]MCT3657981.1 adenylate/guanylate cyclase domain-containin